MRRHSLALAQFSNNQLFVLQCCFVFPHTRSTHTRRRIRKTQHRQIFLDAIFHVKYTHTHKHSDVRYTFRRIPAIVRRHSKFDRIFSSIDVCIMRRCVYSWPLSCIYRMRIYVCFRLESAAMVAKSDIAATRLRYEQQVYNLQTELNSLQVYLH